MVYKEILFGGLARWRAFALKVPLTPKVPLVPKVGSLHQKSVVFYHKKEQGMRLVFTPKATDLAVPVPPAVLAERSLGQ